MRVYFDKRAFESDLLTAIKGTLIMQGDEIYSEAINRLFTKEGKESLTSDGIKFIDTVAKVMFYQFTGGAYFAMDEFGQGSKMDTDNPELEQYKNSDLWNKNRIGNAIYSRDKGKWTDIFGEPRENKSSPKEPINLEEVWKESNPEMYERMVREPSHALRDAFRSMNKERSKKFYDFLIDNMDFSKYIKVSATKKVR